MGIREKLGIGLIVEEFRGGKDDVLLFLLSDDSIH